MARCSLPTRCSLADQFESFISLSAELNWIFTSAPPVPYTNACRHTYRTIQTECHLILFYIIVSSRSDKAHNFYLLSNGQHHDNNKCQVTSLSLSNSYSTVSTKVDIDLVTTRLVLYKWCWQCNTHSYIYIRPNKLTQTTTHKPSNNKRVTHIKEDHTLGPCLACGGHTFV